MDPKAKKKVVNPPLFLPKDPARKRAILGIESSALRFLHNDKIIRYAKNNSVPFGLTFLDSSLQGMLPTDLTGIGAKGGVGKTQLVTEIAKNLSMQKRKVLFIGLEAELNEIEMRLEFQLYASSWFYDKEKSRSVVFDFRSYRFGKLDEILKKYKDNVMEIFHQRYEYLETFYKTKDFTIENLRNLMAYARDEGFSCIILDHIHFMDLFGQDKENEELSKLMKDIRDLNLHFNIPVIIVAHTRKTQGVLPGLEDFRGTSDIGKIITNCVMIAGRPNSYDPSSGTIDTIISVPKSRAGGRLNVVGLMSFHTQMQSYLPNYRVASICPGSEEVTELSLSMLPYWAKHDSFCVNRGEHSSNDE